MGLIERPWARVKQPTVIPDGVNRDVLADLPAETLAELLRDQLLPTGDREAWNQFWSMLRNNDDLGDRAFDVLEEFLDQAEDALDDAEGPELKRLLKFQTNTDNALQRLEKTPTTSAGERRLLVAILKHQTAVLAAGGVSAADAALWRVLPENGSTPARGARPR